MRRNRWIEAVTFRREPRFGGISPDSHRFAVRALKDACLHRFPIHTIECGDQQRGENRFAHSRVRAGYEETLRRPNHWGREIAWECASSLRIWTSASTRLAIKGCESFAVSDMRRRAVPGGTVGGRIGRIP